MATGSPAPQHSEKREQGWILQWVYATWQTWEDSGCTCDPPAALLATSPHNRPNLGPGLHLRSCVPQTPAGCDWERRQLEAADLHGGQSNVHENLRSCWLSDWPNDFQSGFGGDGLAEGLQNLLLPSLDSLCERVCRGGSMPIFPGPYPGQAASRDEA